MATKKETDSLQDFLESLIEDKKKREVLSAVIKSKNEEDAIKSLIKLMEKQKKDA